MRRIADGSDDDRDGGRTMVTLRELLGSKAPVVVANCPTGKTPYASKREATAHLRRMHGHRTPMHAYCCGFCRAWHLGHRRGAVL
jgi:hypothetical protein